MELPPCHQEIAWRLVDGTRYLRAQFVGHQRIVSAYRRGMTGWLLRPSLAARMVHVRECFAQVVREVFYCVKQNVRDFHFFADQPESLQERQRPQYAIIDCSDSRNKSGESIQARRPGQVFSYINIGDSLEHPDNPNELSADADEFITYARHLGIKKLLLFTHGKCGCMANTMCQDHRQEAVTEETLTLEKRILRRMAFRKDHIYQQVVGDPEKFTSMVDGIVAEGEEKSRLAAEIAHGLHDMALAEDLIRRLDESDGITGEPSMRVILIHKELRGAIDPHIYNAETGRFVRVTTTPPIAMEANGHGRLKSLASLIF